MRRTNRTRPTALLVAGVAIALVGGIAPTDVAAAVTPTSPTATATATSAASERSDSPDSPASAPSATSSAAPAQKTTSSTADAPRAAASQPEADTSEADASNAAIGASSRYTDHDGIRVFDSGYLAVTPKFSLGKDGKPAAAQLGLVDKTDPAAAADSWRPAAEAIVHIPTPATDGSYTLPAADADYLNGEQSVYGIDRSAADYTARGGTLFGFDTQSLEGQLNAGLAITYNSAYRLETATGRGWAISRSDVDWNADPPTRTIETLWTPQGHAADFYSAPGAYGRSAGWTFSAPGTYCFTIASGLKTKEPKGTPATDLSTHATYTVVVGDLPASIMTCDQPEGGDGNGDGGATTNLVTRGHHDLRTYIGMDGELHWGLDGDLYPLDDVVIGRTPPVATVAKPSGATDMRTVGPVGTKYWYFPQGSTSGAGDYVWPGWSTESMDRSLIATKMGVSLDGFTRNGTQDPSAKVMLLGDTSGNVSSTYFDSSRGVTSFEVGGNSHSHNIWVFTKPGVYCVAMTATVKTAKGHWTSASQKLAFAVGDDVNLQSVQPCASQSVLPLSSALPTAPDRSSVTRLKQGTAQVGVGIEDGAIRSVAETGVRQSDPKLVRDPDDLIVHGAQYDTATDQWRGVLANGGAVAIRTDGIDPNAVQDRHISVGIGAVEGPGTVAAISADGAAKTFQSLSSAIGGSRSMEVPVRSTTRNLEWYFSKPGVYCVPVTYSATLTNGETVTGGDTLTFAIGPNEDGSGIDLSKYTTCSRGQRSVDLSGDGDGDGDGKGPSHADVYIENGTKNRAGATVLNDGHVDVASRLQGGKLDTVVKDTTESATPTWQDLRKTVLQLLPGSKTKVPDGYDFLGKAGSTVWQVDQTQQQGLLWPGWSTESLPEDATKGGVTWALNDVQGYPDADRNTTKVGNFTLYEQVGFGEPDVLLSSTGKRSFLIGKNVHAHGTWAFTQQGVYCMAMTRSAIAADGRDLQHDFVMAIAVGNVSVQDVDPTRCFSGKTPKGTAAGTTAGGDTTGDAETTATTGTPSLANMIQKICTAPTSSGGSSTAAATTVIGRGHVDVGSRIVDGRLRTLVKDGSQGGVTWRELGATTIWLKPAAKVSSPGGAFSFLGAAGSSAWQIPQTQNPDLVWLGWNTEEITSAEVNGPVQWTLNSVDGPGQVTVYELASFGSPEKILSAGGTYSIPLGTHAHGNWGFTAEGTYRLHMTQTVQLAGGGTSTDRQTLTVVVGGTTTATTAPKASTKTTKGSGSLECATAFGSTVPAVSAVDEPEAAQGGGTTAGGIRSVAGQATTAAGPEPGSAAWVLAVIGFGGVLGAGGAGSLATWLLIRRRGLGG